MGESGKRPTLEDVVSDFLTQSLDQIDEAALGKLRTHATSRRGGTPPSRARLLDVLLSTDADISRAVGGFAPDLRGRVRIRDLDSAQASLIEMAAEYERARSLGDKDRTGDCRRAVLHSRQRLDFLLARPNLSEEKRREKSEMKEWFRVWLEAPGLFEHWVLLRRRNAAN